MSDLTNSELIKKATAAIKIKVVNKDRKHGDIGCVLITDKGNIYTGVNISAHVGLCAEQAAAAAMVTNGEYRIAKIVAVREEEGQLYIIATCGRCREFLTKIDEGNLETEVILDRNNIVKLKDLLPHHKESNKL